MNFVQEENVELMVAALGWPTPPSVMSIACFHKD